MLFFYTYLERSDWLVCNFSGKSEEILFLGPIIPNLDFEKKKKIVKCLYQICIQHLQNTLSANFLVDQFAQI